MSSREAGHLLRSMRTLMRAEEMAGQPMADATVEADEVRTRAAHGESQDVLTTANVQSGEGESELRPRRQWEPGVLGVQVQHVRAEIDTLKGLERRYDGVPQAPLPEHRRLLEQRLPVLAEPAASASSATADLPCPLPPFASRGTGTPVCPGGLLATPRSGQPGGRGPR
jgi:hypothetical protein